MDLVSLYIYNYKLKTKTINYLVITPSFSFVAACISGILVYNVDGCLDTIPHH